MELKSTEETCSQDYQYMTLVPTKEDLSNACVLSLGDLGISIESFRHPKPRCVKAAYGRWQCREINRSISKMSNAQGSEKSISAQKGTMFQLQVKDKAVTQRGRSNHKSDSTYLMKISTGCK